MKNVVLANTASASRNKSFELHSYSYYYISNSWPFHGHEQVMLYFLGLFS